MLKQIFVVCDLYFREKDTVSAHTILSIQTYDKVDLSTLFMRLKMRLQSMNQSSNTSLLDLTDVQWVTGIYDLSFALEIVHFVPTAVG